MCAFDLQSRGVTKLGKANEHVGVDYRNHTVETALRQRFLNIEHERFGFGEPCGLDDDSVGLDALDDFAHGCFELAQQRAANATATELGDSHIFSFDHFGVDRHLAEFVHYNRDFRRARRENVAK